MRMLFLSIVFLAGLVPTAFAQENLEAPSVESLFASAHTYFREGKDTEAIEKLNVISAQGRNQGIAGFPSFSGELFTLASSLSENGASPERITAIVDQALSLSPESARAHLEAALFYDTLGWGRGIDLLFTGLSLSAREPTLFAALAVDTMLVVLISLTLSFLLVSVIQLTLRSGDILSGVGKLFPIRHRGFAAPGILLVVMIFPIFFGLLPAIGVWCLLLSRFLPSCRAMGVLSGALILAWGLALPVIRTVGLNMHSPIERAIEAANNFEYLPGQRRILEQVNSEQPNDPLIISALSAIALQENRTTDAEKLLQMVSADAPKVVQAKAYLNIGAIAYQSKRYREAHAFLKRAEELGDTSFEAMYNLALSSISITDVAGHDKYFQLARSIDRSRVDRLVGGDEQRPIFASVPFWQLLSRFTRPFEMLGSSLRVKAPAFPPVVWSTLMRAGTELSVLVLGFLFVIFGFVFRSPHPGSPRAAASVWSLFPGGPFFAGSRPVFGLVLFSVTIAFVMIGMQTPVRFVAHGGEGIEKAALVAAVLVTLLSSFFGLLARRGAEHPGALPATGRSSHGH